MQEFDENTPSDQLFDAVAKIVAHAILADDAKKADFDSPLGGRAAFKKRVKGELTSACDVLITAGMEVGGFSYECITQPALLDSTEFAETCMLEALYELTDEELLEAIEIQSVVMELLTKRLPLLQALSKAAAILQKMRAAEAKDS